MSADKGSKRGDVVLNLPPLQFDQSDTAQLLDEDGETHTLHELYADRRVLLCFTRHLGCRFCKQQAAEINKVAPDLVKHGVTPILVALGRPHHLSAWKAETGWMHELYVDADPWDPPTYHLLGLLRAGKSSEFLSDPRVRQQADMASSAGFSDGGYPSPTHGPGGSPWSGDVLQYGGLFVLGPGNTCLYAFHSEYPGQHPNPQLLVDICARANRWLQFPAAPFVPADAPTEAHKVAWGFEILAVCFCIIEACFVAALSLVPARFGTVVGSSAAGTLYLCFAIATLAAPATVRVLGARATLVGGLTTFCLFVAACAAAQEGGLPGFAVLLPTAVLAGIGGAVLWTAEGAYLARSASAFELAQDSETERQVTLQRLRGEESSASGGKTRPVDLFAGIFNVIFQVAMPLGQLISGLILSHSGDAAQHTVLLTLCSVALVAVARVPEPRSPPRRITSTRSIQRDTPADDSPRRSPGLQITPRYMEVNEAMRSRSSTGGLDVSQQRAFTTDDIAHIRRDEQTWHGGKGWIPATLVLFLKDRRMTLLAPTNLAMGVMSSLLTYYLGARVVAPAPPFGFGAAMIGTLMAVQGASAAVLAPVFVALTARVGRGVVLAIGAACWSVECLLCLWLVVPSTAEPPTLSLLLLLYVLHGAGFSVWQGTGTAAHVVFFSASRAQAEAAFANMKLWSGLGTAAGFAFFPLITDTTMLLVSLGSVLFGIALYPAAAAAHRQATAPAKAAQSMKQQATRARAGSAARADDVRYYGSVAEGRASFQDSLNLELRTVTSRFSTPPAEELPGLTLSFSGPAIACDAPMLDSMGAPLVESDSEDEPASRRSRARKCRGCTGGSTANAVPPVARPRAVNGSAAV
eukprot:TRINITY_DN7596_c0_g1_i1.p1 TRINITY_DN7596_c0_g1~~TRINITY_DN7596_c0_g1_i1.p1  ORF type:complete len:863 (+),score=60.54 TRINITY_DN7596_c0_g1_i1:120-2708(+)